MGKGFQQSISVYTLLSTATKQKLPTWGFRKPSRVFLCVCVCVFQKVGKVTFINYCHLQFINSVVKLKNKTNKP